MTSVRSREINEKKLISGFYPKKCGLEKVHKQSVYFVATIELRIKIKDTASNLLLHNHKCTFIKC